MKSESVVIADQQAAVNTFSGLVHTARQANKVGGGRRASQGELSRIQRWGLSRNKVSLAEAGDGSPPFWRLIHGPVPYGMGELSPESFSWTFDK